MEKWLKVSAFSEFFANVLAYHFEISPNLPENWQKMRQNLFQHAVKPIFQLIPGLSDPSLYLQCRSLNRNTITYLHT